MSTAVAILNTGLVTSVGLSAPAACAAIRARVTNPSETRFVDSSGEWIMGHQVLLEQPWRGRTKLAKMAAMAITECLANVPQPAWPRIPLLLCVAEPERPGRLDGLDAELLAEVQQELDAEFAEQSFVISQGRVSVATALVEARRLIDERHLPFVLIAASDSLMTWPTLSAYEGAQRLLTGKHSNGFMPGEGAAALLVGPAGADQQVRCVGLGFAAESAHIESGEPLRGEGLTRAIKDALNDAGCEMHDLDFRITDLSGEQYYFKEAALAVNRTLRKRKEDFELWHPAESTGETGATSGAVCLALMFMAATRGFAPGRYALLHLAADNGLRAAIVGMHG